MTNREAVKKAIEALDYYQESWRPLAESEHMGPDTRKVISDMISSSKEAQRVMECLKYEE